MAVNGEKANRTLAVVYADNESEPVGARSCPGEVRRQR